MAAVITAALAVWNFLINRVISDQRYTVANMTAAAALVGLARSRRISWSSLGLAPHRAEAGIQAGILGGAAVAAASATLSKLAATRKLYDDQRVSTDDVVYQTLLRIPVGTVVPEEIAFRAVLPAFLDGPQRDRLSHRSAAMFGLWHILPTLSTMEVNEVDDPVARARVVAAGVVATSIAGLALDRLRLRSRSVLAPMLVHWAANASSYAIAAHRQRGALR